MPLTSPHSPISVGPEWQGRSSLGEYGDFVMQTDHVIGEIASAIDAAGFGENTLLVVTSDNGASATPSNAPALEAQGHHSSAQYRGYKSDAWEGGHRVPFIVRWPQVVAAGSESDQTICLTDLMATSADILGATYPATAGVDSVSFLSALASQSNPLAAVSCTTPSVVTSLIAKANGNSCWLRVQAAGRLRGNVT